MADPIGGPGSTRGSCFGSTYILEYDPTPVATTLTTTTYRITYTVDTSTYNDPNGVALDEINFKISSATPTSVVLVSAPKVVTNWTISFSNLNANCCGGGAGSFVCADYTAGNGLAVPAAGPYVWVFDVTLDNPPALFTDPMEASIRARYVRANGRSAGLTSERITLQNPDGGPDPDVPEPSSIVLSLAVAAAAIGLSRAKFAA